MMGFHKFSYPYGRHVAGPNPLLYIPEAMKRNCVFPLPMQYFEKHRSYEFWANYVPKYGAESFHMGPLTWGVAFPSEGNYYDIDSYFEEEGTPEPIRDDATPDEAQAIKLENKKRRIAKHVHNALKLTRDIEATITTGENQDDPDDSEYSEPDENFNTKPARYDEIKSFLLKGAERLALDTMYFMIAENTLLDYIHRLRKIKIKPEEWRHFLRYCTNVSKELFT
jgi:hypothetical protein